MCILMPCKKQVTTEEKLDYYFRMYGYILGFPHPLLVIEILAFSGTFGQSSGDSWKPN